MNTAFLIPKPGLRMRDPDTLQVLPPEGAEVEFTSYWRRRVREGDAEVQAKGRRAKPDHKTTTPAARRGDQE